MGIGGGAVIGGAVGAAIGYAAPAIGSFLGSSFTLDSFMTAGGELVSVSVSGAQIVAAGVTAFAGLGIMFSKNSNWGDDPYARPGQKKRYREFKNKARKNEDWVSKSGKRRLKDNAKKFLYDGF